MILDFTYRNHREEIADRTILLRSIRWEPGNEDYKHPHGYVVHGMDQPRNVPRSFLFSNIIPRPSEKYLIDFTQLHHRDEYLSLINAAEALVASVRKDEHGTPMMQYRDGNGGLVSKETRDAADALQRVVDFYK